MYKGMKISQNNVIIEQGSCFKRAYYLCDGVEYMIADYTKGFRNSEIKKDVVATLRQRYGK